MITLIFLFQGIGLLLGVFLFQILVSHSFIFPMNSFVFAISNLLSQSRIHGESSVVFSSNVPQSVISPLFAIFRLFFALKTHLCCENQYCFCFILHRAFLGYFPSTIYKPKSSFFFVSCDFGLFVLTSQSFSNFNISFDKKMSLVEKRQLEFLHTRGFYSLIVNSFC